MKGEKPKVQPGLQNRPGTFAIITNGGQIFSNKDQRAELKLIMESVIVIQATHISSLDQLAYVALSEQFDVKKVGEKIPAYVPLFELDDKGNRIKVVWEKREEYFNLKNQKKDS